MQLLLLGIEFSCVGVQYFENTVKLSKYSLDQITQTKSRYEASASAYVLCPLATQSASISGSAGQDWDVSRE